MSRVNSNTGPTPDDGPFNFPAGQGQSPFSTNSKAETLTLFSKFQISFERPALWTPYRGSTGPATHACYTPPEQNATLIISADKLPPGARIDEIAGGPFLRYLSMGAKAPIVMAVPILKEGVDSAYMVNAPLTIPGSFVGKQEIVELSMFKNTLVVAKEGHWFSLETQSWDINLDVAREARAQADLMSKLQVLTS